MRKLLILLFGLFLFAISLVNASKLNLNTTPYPFIDIYSRCGLLDTIEVKALTLTQVQLFEIDESCFTLKPSATLYLEDNNGNHQSYNIDVLSKASPAIHLGEDSIINTENVKSALLYIDGWPYKSEWAELWGNEGNELPFINCVNKDNSEPCTVEFVEQGWIANNTPTDRGYDVGVKIKDHDVVNWRVTINFNAEGAFIKSNEPLYIRNPWNATRVSADCPSRTFIFEKPVHYESKDFGFLVYSYPQSGSDVLYCPALSP